MKTSGARVGPALPPRRFGWGLGAALLATVAVIGAIGLIYLKFVDAAARKETKNNLEAVAELKVRQIVNWRAERLGDDRVQIQNLFIAEPLQRFLLGPDDAANTDRLTRWLQILQERNQALRAILVDTQGKPRLTFPTDKTYFGTIAETYAKEAIATNHVMMIVSIIGLLAISSCLGFGFFWRQQSVRFYKEQAAIAEALSATEIRYRRLFEAAHEGILILDAETGMVVDVNPFLVELLGQSREAFLGKKVWELGLFKDIVANQDSFAILQKKENIRYEDVALEGFDRLRHDVEFVSSVYLADHQKVIQCIFRDISERKQAAAALAEKHDLFRTVIDNIPDQVYMKDTDSHFLTVNPVTARFFGADTPDELIGKCDFDFFPRELAEQFLAEEQALLLRNQPCVNREVAVTDSAGIMRWVLTTKVLLHDHSGKITGLLGINRDITERKQAEETLKQVLADLTAEHEKLKATQLQLIEAAKMESVGQLTAGVAHEVKNPLAIALMGLEYLASTVATTDDQVAMVLKDTKDALLRADNIIRELLNFSAPAKLDLKLQDLNAIVVHVLDLVRYEAQKRHVTSQTELGEGLPHLELDKLKIEQALVNLCLNAIEAMPEGGTLLVKTRANQLETGVTEVIAEVADTGPGITEANLAKIFDPFFTQKPIGKGTGLGLSVARRILDLHGGTLRISNRPEGGAKATITLKTQSKEDRP